MKQNTNKDIVKITPVISLLTTEGAVVTPPPPVKLKMRDMTGSFILTISEIAQKKIDYLLMKIPSLEWSGTMFFKVEGDVHDITNLKIKVIDVYPQDIGSGGYTEYGYDEEFAYYVATHPDLLEPDVFKGHIHSHHNMGAFFSGTDKGELIDSAPTFTRFVSLIVNHSGPYMAAVAIKVKELICTSINTTIKTFGETEEILHFDKEHSEEVIYAYYTQVQKPVMPATLELDAVIANLRKKPKIVPTPIYKGYAGTYPNNQNFFQPQVAQSRALDIREQTPILQSEGKREKSLKDLGEKYVNKILAASVFYEGYMYASLNVLKTQGISVDDFKALAYNIEEYIFDYIYGNNLDIMQDDDDILKVLNGALDFIDSSSQGDNEYVKQVRELVYDKIDAYTNPDFPTNTGNKEEIMPELNFDGTEENK